jgi:hypothetical protein
MDNVRQDRGVHSRLISSDDSPSSDLLGLNEAAARCCGKGFGGLRTSAPSGIAEREGADLAKLHATGFSGGETADCASANPPSEPSFAWSRREHDHVVAVALKAELTGKRLVLFQALWAAGGSAHVLG